MKINRALIKGTNWALAGLISMLGFTGCDKFGPDEYGPMVEYGVPNMDFTVKGVVVDKATQTPIKGIRVGYSPEFWAMTMYGVLPAPYKPKAFVLTNSKGEYKLTDRFYIGEIQMNDSISTLPVYVEDIDGEENGLFQSEYLQLDIKEAIYNKEQKGWYAGEYTLTLNVELNEIEIENQ